MQKPYGLLSFRLLVAASLIFVIGCDRNKSDVPNRNVEKSYPAKQEETRIANFFQLSEDVFCGAQPVGDPAFEALKAWGVKTIISVDGANPALGLAKKYGQRYVHIPIGYDGVPEEVGWEIAKAIQSLPGKIYIHCHHGRQRGPAAAAVSLVLLGVFDSKGAVDAMTAMGTAPKYRGLWASAREAKKINQEKLDEFEAEFVETAKVPPLAEAMVSIDETYDNLKIIQDAGWLFTDDHPDLDPPHEALQLREQFFELARSGDAIKDKSFLGMLDRSEKLATNLEGLLRSVKENGRLKKGQLNKANEVMKSLKQTCNACHRINRN